MPVSDLDNERFAHLVYLLERRFRRALERQLEPHGVPFGHWAFLRILWAEEGLSQKELADRTGLTTPTVHAAVTKMEEHGLIVRKVPEGNTTRPLVYLTERGRELRTVLEPLAISTNAAATVGISADDLATTKATLLRMMAQLARIG
ncbi:MAG: MarR family winged helix-turn-helix transcriptional regulator [Pseudomonadota bacterium]